MAMSFNHTLWFIRQCLKALGLWGLVGVCILIVTITLIDFKDNSANSLSMSPEQQAVALQDPVVPVQESETIQTLSDLELGLNTLASVMTLLPEERSLPSILNKIHQQAKLAQISILSADYKWRKLKKTTPFSLGNLVQYEVTFPIKGSDSAIRNMLNAILAESPTVALDGLELKRENVTDAVTEAKVTFIVFLIGGNG
jgi:hypothetical protein